jgi:uncharacterized membrane protein YccC
VILPSVSSTAPPTEPLGARARAAIRSTLNLPSGAVATPASVVAGIRAGTATVVPILAAYATGRPLLVWTALGGWLSTFADTGGAYRARARHLSAFAVGGFVSVAAGALAGRSPVSAVVLVFLWAVGGALLRLYGDALASIGNLLVITFVVSLASAADVGGALTRAEFFFAGCVWATMLTLLVWPLRPWQPARRAIAASYESLARFARGIAAAMDEAPNGGPPWHDLALREHAANRQAIEAARAVLGETRRARVGSSRRGEDLVVLLESAELLFETLVAAADQVEAASRDAEASPALRAALRDAVTTVADALAAVGDSIPVIGQWRSTAAPPAHMLDRAVVDLWDAAEAEPDAAGPRAAAARHAAALLEHAATLVDTGAESVASLLTGQSGTESLAPRRAFDDGETKDTRADMWTILRANLTPDSFVLRHAVRVGVVAAVATWLGVVIRLPHASWVTTTALIVLQPYAGLTRRRGAERLLWTMLGGLLAAALAALLHDRLVIGAIMFPLAVASIAVRTSHYGLFTFFLTPVFVLLAEPAPGNWTLAVVRGLDTLLGGALALLASRLLWPTWEHSRLPAELARMIDALRAYYRAVEWQAVDAPPASPDAVGAARRGVGLASNNVDAAIQRFLAEPPGRVADVESLMTMLTFVRRMAGALTSLVVGGGSARPTAAGHAALARAVDETLAELSDAVREERVPAPLPEVVARLVHRRGETPGVAHGRERRAARQALRTTHEMPAIGIGLERIARQVGVLHAAATRVYDRRAAA